jgi:hypothetical protein
MAFDFPATPTIGQKFPASPIAGVPTYTWDGEKWTTSTGAIGAPIVPAGTLMLFPMAAAPVGWTKDTTHNDKTLRVVNTSGGGSGGTNAFSTQFSTINSGNLALTVAQLASHGHPTSPTNFAGLDTGGPSGANITSGVYGFAGLGIVANGSNSPHGHTVDMRVQYVDIIIASKN